MYPSLPFGPISMPTGPFMAMVAFWVGLDLASRYGRRLGLHPDTAWNVGMIAIVAGLIVARLWSVVQFWYVYAAQPILILSLRPSGFAFWPGLIAALIVGYGYLVYKSLDPVKVGAAFAVGGLGLGAIYNLSQYLTGAALGVLSDVPWALPYYGEDRHPVALYRAFGLLLVLIAIQIWGDVKRPLRTIWLSGFGASLVYLVAGAFQANAAVMGQFRTSQVIAFVAALIFTLLLAAEARSASLPAETEAHGG